MYEFEDDASSREKCYTTISALPSYIDGKQPPTKKAPFSAISGHPFSHTVLNPCPDTHFYNQESVSRGEHLADQYVLSR